MSTSPAAARVAAGPHNLPAQLPSLIGREEAVALVRERLLQAERGLQSADQEIWMARACG